ncbi:MAG TPA: zinc-ribbon domain-containing protein [Gemmatimonadaceae bacterium]|nr:zinc-ribbon domain-containing protein [Gemmatimonadaceae bacterium]
MNVSCPECRSVFRVDPAKVVGVNLRARCAVCGGIIPVGASVRWSDDFSSTVGGAFVRQPEPARAAAPAAVPAPAAAPAPIAAPRPAVHEASPAPAPAVIERPAPVAAPERPRVAAQSAPAADRVELPAPPKPVTTAPPPRAATPAAPVAPVTYPRPAEAPPARRPINPFLANDPNQKARRLARALVSDMIAYHPRKRDEGLRDGTLKQLFREEIKKSYEEYSEQVGREFAESTSHFQDALNEVLAGGKKLF